MENATCICGCCFCALSSNQSFPLVSRETPTFPFFFCLLVVSFYLIVSPTRVLLLPAPTLRLSILPKKEKVPAKRKEPTQSIGTASPSPPAPHAHPLQRTAPTHALCSTASWPVALLRRIGSARHRRRFKQDTTHFCGSGNASRQYAAPPRVAVEKRVNGR